MAGPRHAPWTLLAALAAGAAAAACGPAPSAARSVEALQPPAGLVPPDAAELARQRRERDADYKTAPDSPIPPAERASFEGLSYYDIDEDAQHVVRLERYDDPKPLTMVTTEGELRPAVRLGRVSFERDGTTHALQVYQLRDMAAEHWGGLFLPFMDETTGTETYPAGRYVELVPGPGDWYVLDFNLAYHPLCAYGRTGYQCPRTPDENRLPFPVRAGERNPPSNGEAGSRAAVTGGDAQSGGATASRRR